jgi:ribosomal protein S18 acetylase RimI-like enzyme
MAEPGSHSALVERIHLRGLKMMTQVQSERRLSTVRKANVDDSAAILECLRIAFEPYRHYYPLEGFADTTLTPETLRSRFSTMCILVATSDAGEIVGTVAYRIVDPGEGHIRGMAVLPEWQGCGVAEQLLSAVESELRCTGCSRITLDTTAPLETAIRFYEKWGFRRSGKIGDFFGMPLIEYVKDLR